ncbi:MAG: hypothetical protein EOP00_24835, partial [Pedobacter sp.]
MKSILRSSLFIFGLLFISKYSFAQQYTITDFYKVDSIANQAKPKDALALIEKINTQARAEGNSAMLIKSVIYRMMFQSYLEENSFDKILIDLRKDISLAKQPEKSILQSLLAETYWKFYQQNQWKIAQRTNVQGDIGDDINTWSTGKLIEETTKTYLASLSEIELLKNTKTDFLNHVLAGDKSSRIYRPTLYDLLAHRAIDVFTNTQITLTQEENDQINFNDPIWFAERKVFLNSPLPKIDSTSFYITALQIFKNLIEFHTYNDNKSAVADADFRRLKFIALRNTVKSVYFNALQLLANKSTETEVYADILFEQATLYRNGQMPTDTAKQNLVKTIELANKAIKAYPKSIGAKNSENLINQIKNPELTTQTKQIITANQPAQLYLAYKNVDTIYFKLFKRPIEERLDYKLNDQKNLFSFLEKNKQTRAWFAIVPKSTDYQLHTLITKIDGLPYGNYLLI